MTHREDYIPRTDEDFDGFQTQFITVLTPNAVTWGIPLTNPDYVDLLAKQGDWNTDYPIGRKSAMPSHPQVVAKQTSRHDYEKAIRLFNKRYLSSNGALTNSDKANLGITIGDTVRTRSHVPNYAPSATIQRTEHELHVLRIEDPTNPDTKEMPAGAIGANVYVSITPPVAPATVPDASTFYFLGLATRFEYDVQWPNNYAGKTAYYYARYVDIHGDSGPDCLIFNVVIG